MKKINTRNDPYQLFIDSIRNPGTQRRYKNLLYTFLKLIPNQLYIDSLGKKPENREPKTLAKFFVELARKDTDLASNVIAAYIKEDTKQPDKKRGALKEIDELVAQKTNGVIGLMILIHMIWLMEFQMIKNYLQFLIIEMPLYLLRI